jgi:SAM-dependent methyltransferase
MYDDFSADYDRFMNWPARLAAEMPFIEGQLQAIGARRVLDVACGTGMHAVALAQRGYSVAGADFSTGMVERARANAATAAPVPPIGGDERGGGGEPRLPRLERGLGRGKVRFEVAGFGELALAFGGSTPSAASSGRHSLTGFDGLLCLGNSLPHLLTPADLRTALEDFAACLRPGGLLLIQNRNFDAVLARRERWMEPQAHQEGEVECLFLRFYDFEPDGTLTFNLVTLRREASDAWSGASDAWSQQVASTRLRPLLQRDLRAMLAEADFREIACYGDMQGAPFDPTSSPNLVMTARKW